MSDVGTGIFAKGRVVPEDVVALSVFPFACFGWFVLQGVVLQASTNDCRPYHLTKHPLTKPHLLTRKHSMKVDTTTPCSTNQPKQANGKTDNATTSSGTTLPLAKIPVPTSDTNSSP